MTTPALTLPGLDGMRDTRSLYGDPREVYIDTLTRYPEAVVHGMRRELERLERAGVPAFADGRRIWTPTNSFFINLNGIPSRPLASDIDFDARARHAAQRIATRNGYSFTHTFAARYLKEDSHA